MTNPVLDRMKSLLDEAKFTNIDYKGKVWRMDDPAIPSAAVVRLVTRELKVLLSPAEQAEAIER